MKNNRTRILVRGLYVVVVIALLAISPASLALGLRPVVQTTATMPTIQTYTVTTQTSYPM